MASKIALALLLLASCVSSKVGNLSSAAGGSAAGGSKPPRWLLALEEVYPSSAYIAAIGEGYYLDSAQKLAAANVAAVFRANIKENSSTSLQYSSSGSGAAEIVSRQSIQQQTVAREIDQTLLGLSYSEPFTFPDGRILTVAYLDRNRSASIYRNKIASSNDKIKGLLKLATGNDQSLLSKYAILQSASQQAAANQLLMEQLAVINPQQQKFVKLDYQVAEIRNNLQQIAQQLNYAISLTTNAPELSTIEQFISAGLQQSGLIRNENGDAAIQVVANLEITPYERDNGYQNIIWQLNLKLIDEQGKQVLDYSDQGRESGQDMQMAQLSLLKVLANRVERQLQQRFNNFIANVLQ